MKRNLLLLCGMLSSLIAFSQNNGEYNPFKGFHIGITTQAQLVEPVHFQNTSGNNFTPIGKPGFGFEGGLEFSYHFADYFGVSAGIDLGTTMVHRYIMPHTSDLSSGWRDILSYREYGILFPLKFEFHYPVGKHFWLFSDIGTRLYPGFSGHMDMQYGLYSPNCYEEEASFNSEQEYCSQALYADLSLDLGFYYQLPYGDLLRASIGTNLSFQDGATGSYTLTGRDGTLQYTGSIYSRNSTANFQFAYIHTFRRYREHRKDDMWKAELPRHEFQFNVGDPNLMITSSYLGASTLGSNTHMHFKPSSLATPFQDYSIVRYVPTFSFNYHYRVSKWFWVGGLATFSGLNANFYDLTTDERIGHASEFYSTLMADLRFSYFNRKHVTLYSGLALGVIFDLARDNGMTILNIDSGGQLTAFGVKAGGNHWFGNVELGVGRKGYISTGFGYEF